MLLLLVWFVGFHTFILPYFNCLISQIFSAIYRLVRVGFISPSGDPAIPATYASLDADGWWVTITAVTFVVCEWFNVPAPVAIAGGAVGGIAWWGVTKR